MRPRLDPHVGHIGAAQAARGYFDAAVLSVVEIRKPIGPVEDLKENEKRVQSGLYRRGDRTRARQLPTLHKGRAGDEQARERAAEGIAVFAAQRVREGRGGRLGRGRSRTISFVGFLETRAQAEGFARRRLSKAGRADKAKLLIAEAVRTAARPQGSGPDGRAAALYRAVVLPAGGSRRAWRSCAPDRRKNPRRLARRPQVLWD